MARAWRIEYGKISQQTDEKFGLVYQLIGNSPGKSDKG
jgi:hypothetical protein